MKKFAIITVVAAFILTSGTILAQQKMDDMKGMGMGMDMDMGVKSVAGANTTHVAMAVVKKADPKAGTVTLAHEPVKSMNWPAMTMAFKVKNKMLFDQLTEGKKVEVEFVQDGKGYVITKVK